MIIKTTSSIYEINLENKIIRRLMGVNAPTSRQEKDGEWKPFLDIFIPDVGQSFLIVWEYVEQEGRRTVFKTTMSSPIKEIIANPVVKDSYF